MRDEVPAWPPGASLSTTIVRRPSEAPYTAAARPAGPPPHHPGGLRRSEPDREGRPQRDRHLAEDLARLARADRALDPVDHLDGLDLAFDHREERAFRPGVGRVLALFEPDVGGGPRQP